MTKDERYVRSVLISASKTRGMMEYSKGNARLGNASIFLLKNVINFGGFDHVIKVFRFFSPSLFSLNNLFTVTVT